MNELITWLEQKLETYKYEQGTWDKGSEVFDNLAGSIDALQDTLDKAKEIQNGR